jgi:hypothetical protein
MVQLRRLACRDKLSWTTVIGMRSLALERSCHAPESCGPIRRWRGPSAVEVAAAPPPVELGPELAL